MNYAGLWLLFGYLLACALAVIVPLAVWAWKHRTEGDMEIVIVKTSSCEKTGRMKRIADDERGTIGLFIFAVFSYVSAGCGVIGIIASMVNGEGGAAAFALGWTIWSLLWAAIWHSWSRKKDSEVEVMEGMAAKLETERQDNAKLLDLLEEQNALLREQKNESSQTGTESINTRSP